MVVRGRATSQDSVEGETSWLAEHMIELGLLTLTVVALIIALSLPFLNGYYVDMMGPESKVLLSIGIACGLVSFFGCIIAYQFTKRKWLILACIVSLIALEMLWFAAFVPHL